MVESLQFETRAEFREWLSRNHQSDEGVWLVFGKNKSLVTVKANEALEEALCYGWIDGIIKKLTISHT
ncbi:YdeI family protein [Enterococcus termitis]